MRSSFTPSQNFRTAESPELTEAERRQPRTLDQGQHVGLAAAEERSHLGARHDLARIRFRLSPSLAWCRRDDSGWRIGRRIAVSRPLSLKSHPSHAHRCAQYELLYIKFNPNFTSVCFLSR